MAVQLSLTLTPAQKVRASYQDQPLVETPLADLPCITTTENPYRYSPVELGQRLLAAMGGPTLLANLAQDPERLLLLVTDEATAAVPWEYAATADGRFLAADYGFLRLLPEAPPARPARSGPLNFIVLAADPLVLNNDDKTPRTGYKLDLQTELAAIQRVLDQSEIAMTARRIPPTSQHLQDALLKPAPAILHLSCHGTVIPVKLGDRSSQQAILLLEDQDGVTDPLRGDYLLRMPPPGILRLVVMSACHTAASAVDASLARALVAAGTPAAIGMQGAFPDPLSDEFAATLYKALWAGFPLDEGLRQARQAMRPHYSVMGLPVAYVAPGGWQPLPLQPGQPHSDLLTRPHWISLPPELAAPKVLLGREAELHHLAHTFSQGHRVVTVVGSGGIGKTALSAAFAERFGWRFPGGVIGVTLANRPHLVPDILFRELLERWRGSQLDPALADAPAETLVEILLEATRSHPPLILLDNYESVQQLLDPTADPDNQSSQPNLESPIQNPKSKIQNPEEVRRLHRLIFQLAEAGLPLLLTSRQQPAQLPGEIIFPRQQFLPGLSRAAGSDLFFQHSGRAKRDRGKHQALAEQVAEVTEGHPLAIILLASEFDFSPTKTSETFLADWAEELAAAHHSGLAAHQATFAVAFERSFRHLSQTQQTRLLALSRFPAPFFAEGAALLWGQAVETGARLEAVQANLGQYVQRSLLQVEGYYEDGQPATYRLEPVIARHLRRLAPAELNTSLAPAYAAYATWLVNQLHGETGRSPALARLAQRWLDELIIQANSQPAEKQARYGWQLAVILSQFGRLSDEGPLLAEAKQAAINQADQVMLSRLLNEEANTYLTRGDLNRALELYQQSLEIDENLGDLQGKGATLHNMAQVYLTRGDLNRALELYQQSLELREQVGDLQGKGTTLHNMAQVYLTRGDLNRALELYQQSLEILENLGDLQGKGTTLHNMAQVYLTRGDLNRALELYQQSLELREQVGDLQGKGATLSGMANVSMALDKWAEAEEWINQSLAIAETLGDRANIAFNIVKLGQVAQGRGDLETARRQYQAGLAIFEQLGMPEADQVRQMLAGLAEESGEGDAAGVTLEEALLALTRAAIGAAEGQHPVQAVAATIEQLAAQPELPPGCAAYLQALAAAVRQPQPAHLDQLDQAALALPAGSFDAALFLSMARLCDRHDYPQGAVLAQA